MKLFLTLALITLAAVLQTPTIQQEGSDLVVLKFSWAKYVKTESMIHGVDSPPATTNLPITLTPTPRKDEPEFARNRRDIQARGADLRSAEQAALRSAAKGHDLYLYRLQVKNAGTKVIKSFIWEYQASPSARENAPRQFLCNVKTKPNESSLLEVISPSAPSRVIDVTDATDSSQKTETAVINRVEFVDGSSWQRAGWAAPMLPSDVNKRFGSSKCIGF
jgi:hypothetical protein